MNEKAKEKTLFSPKFEYGIILSVLRYLSNTRFRKTNLNIFQRTVNVKWNKLIKNVYINGKKFIFKWQGLAHILYLNDCHCTDYFN